jgi:hypothetical protein
MARCHAALAASWLTRSQRTRARQTPAKSALNYGTAIYSLGLYLVARWFAAKVIMPEDDWKLHLNSRLTAICRSAIFAAMLLLQHFLWRSRFTET